MGGEWIPPDEWLGDGRDQRGVGRGNAKERNEGGRDPEQGTKAARAEDGTYEGRRDVQREVVGRSKELLNAKYVRGDGAEGAEDCSGRGVAREPGRSRRFGKGISPKASLRARAVSTDLPQYARRQF